MGTHQSTVDYSQHYNDVIMSAIASQITSLAIVYSTVFIQTQIKENIKAPRHWPLCGEFTGDRWIPRTNGQSRGKCFHLMTSSWKGSVMRTTFLCHVCDSWMGNGFMRFVTDAWNAAYIMYACSFVLLNMANIRSSGFKWFIYPQSFKVISHGITICLSQTQVRNSER